MESAALISFSLAIVLATAFGVLAKFLGQPTLVAYLAAGTVLSFLGEKSSLFLADFSFLPEIGLVFLLFLVGLELDLRRLASMGRNIILASVGQMIFSTLAGIWISSLLGFAMQESVYLGLGLAFSSTIVVVKLFTDRQEMDSLHGRLALGILLVEDLAAVLVLMFLSLSHSGLNLGITNSMPLLSLVGKAILLGLTLFLLAKYGFPKLLMFVSSSVELLFLSAIAICFFAVGLFSWAGFSREIGAFVAGVLLGNSDFRVQIAARIKPLRDLFVAIFFIELGVVMGHNMGEINLFAILGFSAYALIIKPVFFVAVLSLMGYRWHTIFQTAIGLSQVSEFSLIVLSLALVSGHVSPSALSLMAFTTIGTMAISSFLITHSGFLYRKLGKHLRFLFGDKPELEEEGAVELNNHVILIGSDRSGGGVLKYIKSKKKQVVVIDFNPEVVAILKKSKTNVIFGDASDPEVIEAAKPHNAKLIISTVRDFQDNAAIIDTLKKMKVEIPTIMSAMDGIDSKRLKKMGASEVVIPLALESESIIKIISPRFRSA